jgi:hypothetical protein
MPLELRFCGRAMLIKQAAQISESLIDQLSNLFEMPFD